MSSMSEQAFLSRFKKMASSFTYIMSYVFFVLKLFFSVLKYMSASEMDSFNLLYWSLVRGCNRRTGYYMFEKLHTFRKFQNIFELHNYGMVKVQNQQNN